MKTISTVLEEQRLLRVKQIIGDPNGKPPIPSMLPISKSTFWQKVKNGVIPKPIYPLGPRIALWKMSDILCLMKKGS